jgi:hypothetical protein
VSRNAWEYAYEDAAAEWQEELEQSIRDSIMAELALEDHGAARLRTALLDTGFKARGALRMLNEARALGEPQWRAALCLAFGFVEVSALHLMLDPVVRGSIEHGPSGKLVAGFAIRRQLEDWPKLLASFLDPLLEVKIQKAKRPGAKKSIAREIVDLGNARNGALHRAEDVTESAAREAVAVAAHWKSAVYGEFIKAAGLHLREDGELTSLEA